MERAEEEGNGGTPLETHKRRGRKRGRAGASHGKKTSLRPEHGVVEGPIGGRCWSNTAKAVSMETEMLRVGEETRHPERGGPERRQRGWLGLPSSQALSFFLPMLAQGERGTTPTWGRALGTPSTGRRAALSQLLISHSSTSSPLRRIPEGFCSVRDLRGDGWVKPSP